jgi:hypothetical protein
MLALNKLLLIAVIFVVFLTIKYVQSAECPADDLTPLPGSGKNNITPLNKSKTFKT